MLGVAPRHREPSNPLPPGFTSNDDVQIDHETVLPNLPCHWFRNILPLSAQASLFDFLKQHDRTDWENLPKCMNPSPKTLQLGVTGGVAAPVLTFNFRETMTTAYTAPHSFVLCVADHLRRLSLLPSTSSPTSFSLAVIRYQSPNGKFPRHVDHCNDRSLVFLFSLGNSCLFRVAHSQEREIVMRSGDVMVFDPSTEAGVEHEVKGVVEGSCPLELAEMFEEECGRFRYGIQCRVHFE